MSLPEDIEPLYSALESVQRLLGRFGERGVIIGGVAASLLGEPRYTQDLDALILLSVKDIPRLLEEAKAEGLEPRRTDAAEFAGKNRVLLLRHIPSKIQVDISLGILPFEQEMVARSSMRAILSLKVRLPAPEDLIIMKAIAHRPKDLEDILAIARKNPGIDLDRIESWVKSFAEALELPELWGEINKLLGEAI
jgi:predicted nucleotidyltransferase